MTNFELITQSTTTLEDFISAIVDDALEAKGCSLDLKLLSSLQDGAVLGWWKEWLEAENKDEIIYLPHGVWIERQGNAVGF